MIGRRTRAMTAEIDSSEFLEVKFSYEGSATKVPGMKDDG